jgi:hypothetical protein
LYEGLASGKLDNAIQEAMAVLQEPAMTPEMEMLREEARVFGEETNRLFGIRDAGYFRMERALRDLAGYRQTLEKALATKSRAEKRALMRQCIEDTGKPTRVGNIFG